MRKDLILVVTLIVMLGVAASFYYFNRGAVKTPLPGFSTKSVEKTYPDLSSAKFLVEIDDHPTLGNILIDSESGGKTLYYSTQAKGQAGGDECGGWTPRWAPEKLPDSAAPAGVQKDLSLVKWPNGQSQLAYKGKALYLFDGDNPGDTNGEGKCGTWKAAVVEGDPYAP